MAGTSTSFTLTLGDLGTIAGIAVIMAGFLTWIIKQSVSQIRAEVSLVKADVALELARSENRIVEKVKLQFAQKEITDLQLKDIQKDVEELKKVNGK